MICNILDSEKEKRKKLMEKGHMSKKEKKEEIMKLIKRDIEKNR